MSSSIEILRKSKSKSIMKSFPSATLCSLYLSISKSLK
nr:MAG TPA: hypothetical protein [Caudoviricetes sp.]